MPNVCITKTKKWLSFVFSSLGNKNVNYQNKFELLYTVSYLKYGRYENKFSRNILDRFTFWIFFKFYKGHPYYEFFFDFDSKIKINILRDYTYF